MARLKMSATNVSVTINQESSPKDLKDLGRLTIRLGEKDNVVTALADIEAGEYWLNGEMFVVREKVPQGFKLATTIIRRGAKVYKYNYPIGLASKDITSGELVHIHNLVSTVK